MLRAEASVRAGLMLVRLGLAALVLLRLRVYESGVVQSFVFTPLVFKIKWQQKKKIRFNSNSN